MKNKSEKCSKPYRVLLHLACQDNEWRGKAISFNHNNEYNFSSLTDLKNWLEKQDKKLLKEIKNYENES